MYNISFMDNSTSMLGYMSGMNNAVDGLFGAAILMVLFIIMMINMKNYDTKVALLVSSTIVALLAAFMVSIGFISITIFWIPIILWIACIIIYQVGG